MKVFGLTGGVGMGKSTAAGILRGRGIPVVDTDDLARRVVEPGQPALEEIKSTFGPEVISPDGTLQRKKLADIVFCNLDQRRKLEEITHPRIRDLWRAQLDIWRGERHSATVVVIPLLFETSAERYFDQTICVACSAATQRERLIRRGWNTEQIRHRTAAQWPIEKKMAASNYVIWAEGQLDILASQLNRIFAESFQVPV